MMYWNGMGGWGYLFMTLNTLLFWGLVVAGIVVLVRHFGPNRQAGSGSVGSGSVGGGQAAADPQRILAERYARGEIDDDEYQRRLDTLRRGGPTAAKT